MKHVNSLILIIGLIIGLGIGYIAFGESHDEHLDEDLHQHELESEAANHSENAQAVQLSEDELKELGITLDKVKSGNIKNRITLTGEIAVDPIKVTHLRPRYAGIVKEIYVDLGESVSKGDTVAIIESNESLVEFPLIAPVEGTIISIHMSPGEIKGDHEHAIEIANLKYVWAVMTVYQKDISVIKVGQAAQVFDELSGYKYNGRINFISPVIDEETRTTTARIELVNAGNNWKPGMFVNADLLTGSENVKMLVGKEALQTYEGLTVVFVKDKLGFRPQPVTIGKQSADSIEILSGLHIGDEYVSKGAFTIKSEMMKESFGGGHSH